MAYLAEQQSEDRAVRTARALADKHSGVIAWSMEANVDLGEYGPPTVLFQAGDVPDRGIEPPVTNPLDKKRRHIRRIFGWADVSHIN